MANISAQDVKQLRERTGAGMMECKKALVEAEGNMEAAENIIAKAGLRKVQKSSSRTAAEGVVLAQLSPDQKTAALIEVNSETDFVARDQSFQDLCQQILQLVLKEKTDVLATLLEAKLNDSQTLEEGRQALISKIGENIQFRRATCLHVTDGIVGAYTHDNRIGVIVHLSENKPELAKDVAMHVAAMNPKYITPDQVPQELVEKEKEIFEIRAKETGKPDNILEKIVEGQVKKYLNEICLVGQSFIKDQDKTVGQLLKENNTSVNAMYRYEVGEGIEVDKKSFQEEVMSQVRGN